MNVAASIDHSTLSDDGFKVVTDEEGGGWRGRVVRMSSDNGGAGDTDVDAVVMDRSMAGCGSACVS